MMAVTAEHTAGRYMAAAVAAEHIMGQRVAMEVRAIQLQILRAQILGAAAAGPAMVSVVTPKVALEHMAAVELAPEMVLVLVMVSAAKSCFHTRLNILR